MPVITVTKPILFAIAAFALMIGSVAKAQSSAVELYNLALQSIDLQDYSKALSELRDLQRDYPSFPLMGSVTSRIAVLQEATRATASIAGFLSALSSRDQGQYDQAVTALELIAGSSSAGALIDDALYMVAYIQVMDRFDYAAARQALAALQHRFPESAYTDTALYLNAIAMEQQGLTEEARHALTALRDKHSALSLPFDFHWPKGSALSHYWFNRTDRRLKIIETRLNSASTVLLESELGDGRLQLTVDIDGVEMTLLLSASPLIEKTNWRDGVLNDQLPPAAGVYQGVVDGVDDSWVRLVLRDGSISGMVSVYDEQIRLTPANLAGTLDYYQPLSKNRASNTNLQYDPAIEPPGLDYLIAPDELASTKQLIPRRDEEYSDVRDVAVSIVVDSAYDRYYSGQGLITAINNLNVADGIYRDYGLAISLGEALQFSEDLDPLQNDSMTLEGQLNSFRDYRLQHSTQLDDSSLSYFFTGNHTFDGTLGLAWIDTLCRSDGYDAGVTTPSSFGDVLLIHEIGHSFGALHDSQTQCNTDPLSVMWPTLSERSTTELSACAVNSIAGALAKSCLGNTIDLSIYATSTGSSVSFTISNIDSTISTDLDLVVETSVAGQLEWPANCQLDAPTSATCFIEQLQGLEQRTIKFPVNLGHQYSGSLVSAEVTPDSLLELDDSNNVAYLTISPDSVGGELAELSPVDAISGEDDNGETVRTGAASSGGSAGVLFLGLVCLMLLSHSGCKPTAQPKARP